MAVKLGHVKQTWGILSLKDMEIDWMWGETKREESKVSLGFGYEELSG